MGSARRGDIRNAIFAYLREQPGHGYQIMQFLEDRTGGVWRPSPGSMYPTLQQLEDEGLVRSVETEGRRVYELTEHGISEAESRLAANGGAPWEHITEAAAELLDIKKAMTDLQAAVAAAVELREPATTAAVTEMVRDTRRKIYSLLADT